MEKKTYAKKNQKVEEQHFKIVNRKNRKYLR